MPTPLASDSHDPGDATSDNPQSESDHLDEILAAYLRAIESGENPSRNELLARHPDLSSELREFFTDHDRMNRLAQPLCEATLANPAIAAAERIRYFGDYEVLEEIARGGMGVVFKARQVTLNRIVAIKMILSGHLASPADVERFHTEAEAAAKLDHPGIVPIYEVGQHAGQHYFSMGFVDGISLSAKVAQGPLPAREAAELVRTVAEAVQYAHENGVIHRDLKPGNILLDRHGKPRITDFGLAKLTGSHSDLTGTGQILGTPGYMPPEQAAAQANAVGHSSDIYSLGAILYCLLTGRPPFQSASPLETLMQVQKQEPVSPRQLNSNIPLDLDTIVLKCLEKSPARRYATAKLLAEELNRYLNGQPILARRIGHAERFRRWCRREPLVASLSAAVLVTLIAGISFSTYFAVEESNRATSEAQARNDEKKQRQEAERLTGVAKDQTAFAIKQTAFAEEQRGIAVINEEKAKVQTLLADRRFYASQMNLAMQAWQAGEMPRVLELLEGQRPGPDGVDLRGFEWHYLWRQCQGGYRIPVKGHTGAVLSLAFTPDGKSLASASWDRTVRLWDAETGNEQRILRGHNRGVWDVAISPDGRTVASGGKETRSLILWDARSGQPIHTIPESVGSLVFSADGKTLAGGAVLGDDVHTKLWEVATGAEHAIFPHAGEPVGFLVDGRTLLTMAGRHAETGAIHFWDLESRTTRLSIQAPGIVVAALSGDGACLATSHWSRPITLWDTATGNKQIELPEQGAVRALSFSPDGTKLATGSEMRTVTVWDVETAQRLAQDVHLDAVWSVAFSPDGTMLASATLGGAIKLWDMSAAEEATSIPIAATAIQFSEDGKALLVGSPGETRVFDVATETERDALPARGVKAISADTSTLAGPADVGRVAVWNARNGFERTDLSLDNPAKFEPNLTLSADGKTLASFYGWQGNDPVLLWNVQSRQFRTLNFNSNGSNGNTVICAEFSPDGKLLAAGFKFQWVRVWDVATGKVKLQFSQNPAMMRVVSVTFSPDNNVLAVGTDVGTVTLWNVETGKRLAALKGHTSWVFSLAFSPDGKTLATAGADRTVRLWDVATGQERAALTGRIGTVVKMQFSPDANTLATAGDNGILTLWRAANDQDVPRSTGHPNRIRIAALDRACELAPGQPEPLIAKAHFHHSHGETAEAEAAFSAAAPLASDELDQFLQAGWWVVGPYPNDLAAAYPPELNLDPARPVDAVVASGKTSPAKPLRWRHAPTIDFGRVKVSEFLPADHPCSVYAMTVVYSPSVRPTALLVGTEGPRRVWLNGDLVDESAKAMTWHFDLDRVPVTLRPGRNTILVKISGNTPPQFFITRLEDSLIDRGIALASAGLFDEAAQHLVRAVRRAGNDDHHAMRVCAISLAAAGDREAYRFWSTRIWTKFGQSPTAETAYYAAHPLTLMPKLPPDLNRWLAALERGMTVPGFNTGHVRTHLALAHLRSGNPSQALQVVRESPAWGDYYPSLPVLALIYHALDDPTQSREALRRADAWFDRTIADSLAARSLTVSNAADFAEFLIFHSEAKPLIEANDPAQDPRWLLITGRAAAQHGLRQRAEADFNAAIDLAPTDSELLIARALVFDQLGWDERAVQDFDRALELQPARPEPLIALAHHYLSRGNAEKAEAAFAAAAPLANDELDQFIQAGWWVVGPYPNELATAYPPEMNLDPSQRVDGGVAAGEAAPAKQLRWRHAPVIEFGRVNLAELLPATKASSAYAMTVVYSPTERQSALLVGSDGPRRVWVNGQLVHESSESQPGWWQPDRVPVTLRVGRNTVLFKVAGNTTPLFFFARLDDSAVDHGLRLFKTPLFDEATERLEKALKREGGVDWGVPEHLAILKAASGDWNGHRQLRDAYWQTFKDANQPFIEFWLAHLYSLANEAPPDRDNWISKLKGGLGVTGDYASRQFVQSHIALGHLLCGNEDEALRAALDGEAESFPLAWLTLALIHHRFERPEEAKRWLQRADDWYVNSVKNAAAAGTLVPVAPMDWLSWTEFVILRREAWSQVHGKQPPQDPWWLLVAAGERARRGFKEGAEADFEAAVKLHPDYPDVWAIRGRIFAELGSLDHAAADLEQAEKLARQPVQFLTLSRAAARSSVSAEVAKDIPRRDEFRRRALEAIRRAKQAGFTELESLRNDPDLKSLRDLPEFQLLVK